MNIRRSTQHIVPGKPFVPSKQYQDWKRFVLITRGELRLRKAHISM